MLKHKLLIFMVAAIFVFGGLLQAQEQSGEIIGTVVLEDGSAIPGVSVEITGDKLIGAKVSVTNENGTYRLMGIPTGLYTVTFSLEGFKTIKRKGIRVDLGKTFKLDVIMQTGALREEVVVTGQIPVVDVRKSASAVNITKEAFSKLPKSSRNFLSIATQQAGVNYEREFDNSTGEDGFNSGGGTAISFDGASASENTFFIDGMNTTTTEGGVSGNNLNTDFIEEVQVKSSGYAAEYGGSMGGVISVITRSGGNEFHGDLSLYYDSDWLQAPLRDVLKLNNIDSTLAEYSDYSNDKWNRFEPGVSLGGYLVKDKLWFFASFMPSFRTRTRVGVFNDAPEMDGTEFDFKDTRYNGTAKITAALGRNIRLSISGNMNIRKQENQLPAQDGSSWPSQGNLESWERWEWKDPGMTLSGNLDYSIGNSGFLSIAGGFFRTNSYPTYEQATPPVRLRFATSNHHFDIPDDLKKGAGYANVGWSDIVQTKYDISRKISAKADLTLYFNAGGEHVVKTGFGWNQVFMDKFTDAIGTEYWFFYWKQPNGAYGVYTVGDGTAYDTTYGFARALGPYGTLADLKSDRFSFYLQDSWTIGDKLTINYGVRLEKEDMPSMDDSRPEAAFTFDFFDKIAPRVGFAYDLKGDGNTKIFGSFGIYYDVMKMDMAVGSFGGLKWHDAWYDIGTLDWTQYANYEGWGFTGSTEPILGGQLYEHVNHRVPSFDLVQPDIKPGSKMEISLGFQQKISDDLSFTARFLHHRILDVIEDIGVEIAGHENYYIGNPGSDWINEQYALSAIEGYIPAGRVCPDPTREYYSVQLSLDKKFSNNWLGGATVTWSSLRGIISGLASSDEHGRQNPMVQRYFDLWFLHYDSRMNLLDGPLPTDRPLDLKVYGAYTFDFGLTLGLNAFAKTGTPVSTEFMLNNQQGWYPNGRNDMGRTPFLWQLDLYAEYNLKLGSKMNLNLNANVTNLTNNKIAQRIYNRLYADDISRSNDYIVNGFDVDQLMNELGLPVDARYGMEHYFLPAISVRLGAKLSF